MERSATKQHFHCTESHKLKALMIAFGIHLVITCSLLYTQLYQRTEHSKDIKRCHADLNDLRQEFRRREIQQDKQVPHDGRTGKATMKQVELKMESFFLKKSRFVVKTCRVFGLFTAIHTYVLQRSVVHELLNTIF